MTLEESLAKIEHETNRGIAYGSRMGDYGTKESFAELIKAIGVVRDHIEGQTTVDRRLVGNLFVLGNQVEGNVHGALAKGLSVPEWLWDQGIIDLNQVLYEVFDAE